MWCAGVVWCAVKNAGGGLVVWGAGWIFDKTIENLPQLLYLKTLFDDLEFVIVYYCFSCFYCY